MTEEVLRWILEEKLIERGDRVLAGVSGGADSVCLLLLLLKLRENIGYELSAVHVEHGIRGEESLADAQFVAALCEKHGVSCIIFHPDVPDYAAAHGLGIEEAARILRYNAYLEAAKRTADGGKKVKIALAHHADDNAETILFQMIRGSGIRGMCGMRASRPLSLDAVIIRPLLTVTRQQIEQYLAGEKQDYRTDSTNSDIGYSRNRIRHEVMPELLAVNRQAVSHLNRSALLMQEICGYLESQMHDAEISACRWEGKSCTVFKNQLLEYPMFLQKELLLEILGRTAGSRRDIGSVHVEMVLELFGHQAGRSLRLPHNIEAERVYGGVRIREQSADERSRGESVEISQALKQTEDGATVALSVENGELRLRIFVFNGKIEEIPKKKYTKWLDYDKIKGSVLFRRRSSGDYLTIDGDGHRKKLKSYFVEEKVPREERERIWLLAEGNHIIWVIGRRISAEYKIAENTERILEVQFTGGNIHED